MSYIINLTNGTQLTEVKDGGVDQSATDLTLIGKNATNYGTFVNDNLVHILENFANPTQPNNPLVGQLWYDTSNSLLKVYTGRSFVPTGNTVVSATVPADLATGGLWIDNSTSQLYFKDGNGGSPILAGPVYSTAQGKSGFETVTIIDSNDVTRHIVKLWVSNVLIGIYSSVSFIPRDAIVGYTGAINIGFNAGSFSGISFQVPVSKAAALIGPDGVTALPSTSFVSSVDELAYMTGSLSIQNGNPLRLGEHSEFEISVVPSLTQLSATTVNQNFQIGVVRPVLGLVPALYVNATTGKLGVFTNTPATTLDVNGDSTIRGSLTVTGATSMPLGLSLDTTGMTTSQIISTYLNVVYPVGEHLEGTLCRVVCTDNGDVLIRLFTLLGGVWTHTNIIA